MRLFFDSSKYSCTLQQNRVNSCETEPRYFGKVNFYINSRSQSKQMRRQASGQVTSTELFIKISSQSRVVSLLIFLPNIICFTIINLCLTSAQSPVLAKHCQVRLFIHRWPDSLHDNAHYNQTTVIPPSNMHAVNYFSTK